MNIQIKNRWNGNVIFECDAAPLKLAVEMAVSKKVSLRAANLRAADLRAADLRDANHSAANLRAAVLTPVRDDLWAVLSASPSEVPALRTALLEGKVDGSTYSGVCARLVGTLANARRCDLNEIPGLKINSSRPAERWFLNISPGDVPSKNQHAKLAVEWIDSWLSNMQAAAQAGAFSK